MYLDAIVGKDNLGSVTRVPDANYDKQTGAAVYAKTPDYFAYSYDTGRKGLPAMTVYFEMQGLTSGVALDEKAFPDAAFRTLLADTADVNGQRPALDARAAPCVGAQLQQPRHRRP